MGSYGDYQAVGATGAPRSITMDRMNDIDEFIVAQATQLFCRKGCCHPSMNWVLKNGDNYEPGSSPFDAMENAGGWVHEESIFTQRCCFGAMPGCRETRFVQHAGTPPLALTADEGQCCIIQTEPTSNFLSEDVIGSNVVAVHQKEMTCSTGCCCNTPYLETTDGNGNFAGETRFICDECIFVPKFHVYDRHRDLKYLIRPDTCCGGLCVMPRCGGRKGKCLRVPFLVRDPYTREPLHARTADDETAQVTELWSGWVNEFFYKRNAYHLAFPSHATPEDKLTLTGAAILIDVALFENEDNSGGDGGGA